jgi:thioredoxin-dependent peroxiredoxin
MIGHRSVTSPTSHDRADDQQESNNPCPSGSDGRKPTGAQIAASSEELGLRILQLGVREMLHIRDLALLNPVGMHLVDQRLDRGSQPIPGSAQICLDLGRRTGGLRRVAGHIASLAQSSAAPTGGQASQNHSVLQDCRCLGKGGWPRPLAATASVLCMTIRLSDGDAAPAFTLPDADGKNVSLADFPGQRVIVYFYPAAMTAGCTTQAIDFTAAMEQLGAAGLHVLGISPDAQEKLIQFREKESVGFPLLSDPNKSTLTAYGAYGEKLLYGKLIEGVIRSTFVIDVDQKGHGTIAVAQYNVKASGHVDKLKRDLHL